MDSVKTWGQALEFQMRRWKRTRSAKTTLINSNHITRHVGLSYPISKMGKTGFWMNLQEELLDEQKSSSTVNRICSTGSHVIKQTYLADLHKTPCPKFKRLKEGQHRMTWFTKDQVEQLVFTAIDVFDRPDIADAILFSAFTGVRQGELLKLKGRDLDLSEWKLWIGGKPDLVTKGSNVRWVRIPERIRDICIARQDNKLLFGGDWKGKDQLYYHFCRIRDYCDIPNDHVWHSLRHSYGTWLGEVTQIKTIQACMGHSDISTTMRYVKATDSAIEAAGDAL